VICSTCVGAMLNTTSDQVTDVNITDVVFRRTAVQCTFVYTSDKDVHVSKYKCSGICSSICGQRRLRANNVSDVLFIGTDARQL